MLVANATAADLGAVRAAYASARRIQGTHLYFHRIARAATGGRGGLVQAVLDWAWERCRALGRRGLRIDTWASNAELIAFYERHGFHLVGRCHIETEPRLPAHYHHGDFALLEASLSSETAGRDHLSA